MKKGTRGTRPVVIAVTSDQHCGGTTALCPDDINLDDGGHYRASKAQRWLWQCWGEFWAKVDATRKANDADLYQVFNGDMVDGAHHHTTQLLSENPNAQAAVVNAAMAIPLALNPEKLWVVRGTEVHTGQSASAEERIADGLRRDKRPVVGDSLSGTASHWHVRMEVHGTLIDITHHGRTGMREHTRGGAAVLYAHDIVMGHVKNGDRYPDLAIRGHHHRFNDSHDAAPTRVITTGAWQLATGFVHRIAADSLSDIGGLIVVLRAGEPYDARKIAFRADRGPVWKP